jgi:hypothetical protein
MNGARMRNKPRGSAVTVKWTRVFPLASSRSKPKEIGKGTSFSKRTLRPGRNSATYRGRAVMEGDLERIRVRLEGPGPEYC